MEDWWMKACKAFGWIPEYYTPDGEKRSSPPINRQYTEVEELHMEIDDLQREVEALRRRVVELEAKVQQLQWQIRCRRI
jgi:predicted RNase H-like nuclease (RuvC/YqgF family)